MAYQAPTPLSSRIGGIAFVAAFHLAVIYFLATALNINVAKLVGPIAVDILTETNQGEPPPPPPPALDQPPPDFVPPPEVSIDFGSTGNALTSVTTTKSVAPTSDRRHPNSRPNYPEASVRLNEEGSVVLALYVGADGKVTESKVEKSSGYPRLDTSAQQASLRYRFIPGKIGGQPAAMWHRIKITFRLCEEKQIRCTN